MFCCGKIWGFQATKTWFDFVGFDVRVKPSTLDSNLKSGEDRWTIKGKTSEYNRSKPSETEWNIININELKTLPYLWDSNLNIIETRSFKNLWAWSPKCLQKKHLYKFFELTKHAHNCTKENASIPMAFKPKFDNINHFKSINFEPQDL